MFIAFAIAWALLGIYAVVGNIVVYAMLAQRQVPVRSFWAGTPGYLARVCSKNPAQVGSTLLWFARSTIVALLACFLLAPVLLHGR